MAHSALKTQRRLQQKQTISDVASIYLPRGSTKCQYHLPSTELGCNKEVNKRRLTRRRQHKTRRL